MSTQMQTSSVSFAATRPVEQLFHRVWPPVSIGFGVGLTAAWVSFLAYELIALIGL
jgi:hypothetical protein